MAKYQTGIIPIQPIVDRHHWVEFVANSTDSKTRHIRCGLCYRHSKRYKLSHEAISDISKKYGVLKNTESANLKMLQRHAKSGQHFLVTQELRKDALKGIKEDDYVFEVNHYHDSAYQVTMRMMRLVYVSVSYSLRLHFIRNSL